MVYVRMALRLFLFWFLIMLVTGCERRLPPGCYGFIAEGDNGRFELKAGGLAYDPDNDIEWFRCSVGQRLVKEECLGVPMIVSWTDAVESVSEINQKSGTQWRLPSLDELASLGVKGCGNPSINVNVFPNAMVNNYWAKDESPHTGFRCGMYTFSGATSCRLFDNLERPFFMVRSPK